MMAVLVAYLILSAFSLLFLLRQLHRDMVREEQDRMRRAAGRYTDVEYGRLFSND